MYLKPSSPISCWCNSQQLIVDGRGGTDPLGMAPWVERAPPGSHRARARIRDEAWPCLLHPPTRLTSPADCACPPGSQDGGQCKQHCILTQRRHEPGSLRRLCVPGKLQIADWFFKKHRIVHKYRIIKKYCKFVTIFTDGVINPS